MPDVCLADYDDWSLFKVLSMIPSGLKYNFYI